MSYCCRFGMPEGLVKAHGDDITKLLKSLPALPALRAVRITATCKRVGPVDMCSFACLEHLALACMELTLCTSDGWDPNLGPTSLHFIVKQALPETVGFSVSGRFDLCAKCCNVVPVGMKRALFTQVEILQRMEAVPSTVWTGQLYTSESLQQWKAGPPHALDLRPCSMPHPTQVVFNHALLP